MNRRTFAKSLAAGGTALGTVSYSPARAEEPYRSASPVDVGNKGQLFVDRVLVREAHEVSFTLHPAVKHPNNPLVVADRPWEGWRLEIFGTVLYDQEERLFKMWYIAEPVGVFGPPGKGPSGDNPTCYATSSDGIHWEKPLVGVIPANNGQKHNALLYATHLPSVTKDREESDPGKRYKMICYINEPKEWRGYNTMVSPDGGIL